MSQLSKPSPLRAKASCQARDLGRVANADRVIAKYGAGKVQPLLDGMLTADQYAHRVVEDLRRMRGGSAMYARAVEHGIDSVPEAPDSMREMFAQMESIPDWVDWDQLRRGSVAYLRAGPLVTLVFTCASIAGGDQSFGSTRPQVWTGRFREKAYVRSAETVRWLVAATKPGGMRRDADGFKLSAHVRLLHGHVRAAANRSTSWDWDNWGMPICDTDGGFSTAYAFTGVYLDALRKAGFRFTDQELEDIYALWRYIGHVMGVSENLLHTNRAEAEKFTEIYLQLNPGPDEAIRRLVHSLIELATQEDGGGNSDGFPAIVTKMMPPLRLRKLMYGLMRFWLGDALADQFQAPNARWRYAGYGLHAAVTVSELARRCGIVDDEKSAAYAVDLMERSTKAGKDESILAPPEDVIRGLEQQGFLVPTSAEDHGA